MKRAFPSLLSLALGVMLTGVIHTPVTPDDLPVDHDGVAEGSVGGVLAADLSLPLADATPRRDDTGDRANDLVNVRRRLRAAEMGTYIGDMLLERDSSLARWADRRGDPLTVWVEPESNVAGFHHAYVARVREAFGEWGRLRLPVQFAFVGDSADAEVHVKWIDRFTQPISGRTRWTRDDNWEITDANIVLAVHHNSGEQLDPDAMHAMALHEIGHLLGLDHTQDTLSVMAPRVRVRHLSEADRATARLLYALPAGPLR